MYSHNSGDHSNRAAARLSGRRPPASLALPAAALATLLLGACGTVQQALNPVNSPVVVASAAGRLAPMQGSGQEVYRGQYSYVRIVPAEPGAATSFPLYVEEEKLRTLLKELLGAPNASFSDRPLFSRAELAELVTPLRTALANARSGEDVLFAISGTHKPLSVSETESVTTGRLFVADNRLNLILGMTRVNFGDALAATGTLRSFDQASRAASLASAEAVRGGPWQPAQATRTDWLTVPLESLGYLAGMPTVPATVMPALGAASGGRMPVLTAPAPATASAVTAAPAGVADPDGSAAERRLATLERLRQKGLITQQEYETKRKTVLDGL